MTLNLSAPPAGSQLVVNETTTIALGQTTSVNGDSITFEAGAGNQARIIYRVLSNFTAPGNFCLTSIQNLTAKEVQHQRRPRADPHAARFGGGQPRPSPL